jgi:hypothetical protein
MYYTCLYYLNNVQGSREGRNTPYPSLEIDVMYHYYMVEPGRNLYYVPALFSAPHMSNFGTKIIPFFICNLLIGSCRTPHDFLFLSDKYKYVFIGIHLLGCNLYYVPPMDHVIYDFPRSWKVDFTPLIIVGFGQNFVWTLRETLEYIISRNSQKKVEFKKSQILSVFV